LLDKKELGEGAGALRMKMGLSYKQTAWGWERNTDARERELCESEIRCAYGQGLAENEIEVHRNNRWKFLFSYHVWY